MITAPWSRKNSLTGHWNLVREFCIEVQCRVLTNPIADNYPGKSSSPLYPLKILIVNFKISWLNNTILILVYKMGTFLKETVVLHQWESITG